MGSLNKIMIIIINVLRCAHTFIPEDLKAYPGHLQVMMHSAVLSSAFFANLTFSLTRAKSQPKHAQHSCIIRISYLECLCHNVYIVPFTYCKNFINNYFYCTQKFWNLNIVVIRQSFTKSHSNLVLN